MEAEGLTPGDVMRDLVAIHKAINACDPFYRYDLAATEDPPAEDQSDEPGLVAVCGTRRDGVWITVKIFALSLVALEEQPIRMQFRLAVPADDDDLREQVAKFIDYGAPLMSPTGTVSGTLDLPASLGGAVSGASLRIPPVTEGTVSMRQS